MSEALSLSSPLVVARRRRRHKHELRHHPCVQTYFASASELATAAGASRMAPVVMATEVTTRAL